MCATAQVVNVRSERGNVHTQLRVYGIVCRIVCRYAGCRPLQPPQGLEIPRNRVSGRSIARHSAVDDIGHPCLLHVDRQLPQRRWQSGALLDTQRLS